MTRLIKLMMVVATLVVVSAVQAQFFDEVYTGTTTNGPAYVASNGVTWVSEEGLNIENSSAIFEYSGDTDPTNTMVEFTVIPILNDAIPTDVAGAAVVFWVGTDSNVYRLATGDTTVEKDTVNVISGGTAGAVAFKVKINYVAKTFDLEADGESIFSGAAFYNNTSTKFSSVEIRETSAEGIAIVQLFKVNPLAPNGEPTLAQDAAVKVYEKGGKVYVELDFNLDDKPGSFAVSRDGVPIGTKAYVNGQSVYVIEDATAVIGGIYNYTVAQFDENNQLLEGKSFVVKGVKVLPVSDAKSFNMTPTHMTIVFKSYPGEKYQVVGFPELKKDSKGTVLVDVDASSEGDTTEVTVEIDNNFYFKVIEK